LAQLRQSSVPGRFSAGPGTLLLLAAGLASQAATIEGYVAEMQSGRALAHARVTLMPGQARASSTATVFTDSQGRFSITVNAGSYLLGVERQGYAAAWYGQKRYSAPGTPVVVEQDSRFTAEVLLCRLGAVSGKVLDENGVGLPDFPVFLYRDTKPLQLAGQGVTDDRGVFRIARLEPGRYRARTGAKKLLDGSGLLPTFYGNSGSSEASQVVDVRLDSEADGVVITPLPGQVLSLGGEVTFPGVSSVFLYSDMGRRVAGVDSSGRFTFDEVSPGDYELIAESSLGGQQQVGYAKLVATGDMDSISLGSAPAPALRFRCADREGKAAAGKDVSLLARRTSPPDEPRTQRLACGESATLMVGVWQYSIFTPGEYYVSSVLDHGKASESNELGLLPGDKGEVTAVLSQQAGSLKGKVSGQSGQPAVGAMVFLRALDAAAERRMYGKGIARADQTGAFVIEGLPPGRYLVAVSYDVQSPEDIDWRNPSLKTVELEAEKPAAVALEL
jgi:protocatechuate 3,4-dioxygenase beta subunit